MVISINLDIACFVLFSRTLAIGSFYLLELTDGTPILRLITSEWSRLIASSTIFLSISPYFKVGYGFTLGDNSFNSQVSPD